MKVERVKVFTFKYSYMQKNNNVLIQMNENIKAWNNKRVKVFLYKSIKACLNKSIYYKSDNQLVSKFAYVR